MRERRGRQQPRLLGCLYKAYQQPASPCARAHSRLLSGIPPARQERLSARRCGGGGSQASPDPSLSRPRTQPRGPTGQQHGEPERQRPARQGGAAPAPPGEPLHFLKTRDCPAQPPGRVQVKWGRERLRRGSAPLPRAGKRTATPA